MSERSANRRRGKWRQNPNNIVYKAGILSSCIPEAEPTSIRAKLPIITGRNSLKLPHFRLFSPIHQGKSQYPAPLEIEFHRMTMFTSRFGTTTTFTICFPVVCS